jgi:hypothetical protein
MRNLAVVGGPSRARATRTIHAANWFDLFTSSFRNGGGLKPADRDYVSKVVAVSSPRLLWCLRARKGSLIHLDFTFNSRIGYQAYCAG